MGPYSINDPLILICPFLQHNGSLCSHCDLVCNFNLKIIINMIFPSTFNLLQLLIYSLKFPEISQKNRFINLNKQVGSFKLTLRYKLWLPIHIIIQHIQYNQIWQLNVLVDLQNRQVRQLGLLYSKASGGKNQWEEKIES